MGLGPPVCLPCRRVMHCASFGWWCPCGRSANDNPQVHLWELDGPDQKEIESNWHLTDEEIATVEVYAAVARTHSE